MRHLRLLYIHQYFVPPDGVGGTRSLEFARRMAQFGHDVTIVTSSSHFPPHYHFPKFINRIQIEGIRIVVVPGSYSIYFSYGRRMIAFVEFILRSLFAILSVGEIDIVFATSTPLTVAIPAVFAAFRNKCPMVFEVRDLWPGLPVAIGALRNPIIIWVAKWFEGWAYRKSQRVIALSPGIRDGVALRGYDRRCIRVIPNACDNQLFKVPKKAGEAFLGEHSFLRGKVIVSYIGSLGKINNPEYLVEVASYMSWINPDVFFLLVGDGPERSATIRRANHLGLLNKNVAVLPSVPKNEVPRILSASTIAVSMFLAIPGMETNSANKFFDSLASGRPVMINYEGWQADLLRNSGAGIVVPSSRPEEAAQMLNKFISDSNRLRKGEEAARRLADNDFSRDNLAKSLLEVLEEAMVEYKNESHV